MATNERRLQQLSGSDYEMTDGQPDIRGWEVKNSQGQKLGDVEEIIFDEQSLKVRYLVLDLDGNELDLDDKEVLIPIGMAQLHKEDDDVILPNITAEHLRNLPEYDEDHLDAVSESKICQVLGRDTSSYTATGSAHSDEFYKHDHFNDQNLYQNRKLLEEGSSDKYSEGYNLRNRSAASGSEVEGYLGGTTGGLGSEYRNRESVGRTERVEDESAVPVNNPLRDEEQLRRNQNLMDNDQLTGDNLRNRTDDEDETDRRRTL